MILCDLFHPWWNYYEIVWLLATYKRIAFHGDISSCWGNNHCLFVASDFCIFTSDCFYLGFSSLSLVHLCQEALDPRFCLICLCLCRWLSDVTAVTTHCIIIMVVFLSASQYEDVLSCSKPLKLLTMTVSMRRQRIVITNVLQCFFRIFWMHQSSNDYIITTSSHRFCLPFLFRINGKFLKTVYSDLSEAFFRAIGVSYSALVILYDSWWWL